MENQETTPSEVEDVKATEETKTEEVSKTKDSESINSQLLETVKSLQERLDQQSRIIGKLTNEKKKEEKEDEGTKEVNKDSKTSEMSKFSELEQKIQALEEKNKKKIDAVKKNKIAQSIIENGGDTETANDYAEFISFKNTDKIIAEENEVGDVEVKVVDGEETLDINSWMKMYMSSDSGKFLNSLKKGASVKNAGKPTGTIQVTELSPIEYSRTVAQINGDKNLTREQKEAKIKTFKML